jgi:lipoprotein-anchoring transpeptidase ErfK/SrfK
LRIDHGEDAANLELGMKFDYSFPGDTLNLRGTRAKRRMMASWKFVFLGVGLLLGGCMQTTLEPAPTASLKPRDKELLARAPYAQATIPEPFQRHIVEYHRKEAPGTIVIDPDNRYLYLVQQERKAIRYGVTVGEEAQGWSGVAKIGNMTEWPSWTPTAGEHQRLDPLPAYVPGGPQNPMGARAMYLYANGKDTLFRIHGTNQPEYIGEAISSGCIRLTNENVIDLYSRVRLGTPVVVLAPGHGDSPFSAKVALTGGTAQQ